MLYTFVSKCALYRSLNIGIIVINCLCPQLSSKCYVVVDMEVSGIEEQF